jgi:2-polyprenyl-3-methyl-5-hydroxy-6-metoxy-1,4-benzoquinol methylase
MDLMEKTEIETGLRELNELHQEKWYHNYHFGHGIMSIPGQPREDNFLIRSDIVMELIYFFLGVSSPEEIKTQGLRLLDLGSAEGLQSIEAAMHGFDVLGVEGRELFIERAEFARKVFDLHNVRFLQADVRNISKEMLGTFDGTLCLGILYHLNKEAMLPFFRILAEMTNHVLIIDTHIANPASVERYKLGEEDSIEGRYFGRTHYEHPRGLSLRQKLARVRASLDNEKSFWFYYQSLCDILAHHGFSYVFDIKRPVHNTNADFRKTRVLLLASRTLAKGINARCYLSLKSG